MRPAARKQKKTAAIAADPKTSRAATRRAAFESAIRSLMYAPKVYGSKQEKQPDPITKIIDSAVNDCQSAEQIKVLLQAKANYVAKKEAEERVDADREKIKLHPDEMDVIVEIAMDILSGHDARQLLGIKRVRGPRANPDLIQYEYDIAGYFWGLRLRNPSMLAKTAATEVALACGISVPRVRKIARRRAQFIKGVVSANPHLNILEQSKSMLALNFAICRAEADGMPLFGDK